MLKKVGIVRAIVSKTDEKQMSRPSTDVCENTNPIHVKILSKKALEPTFSKCEILTASVRTNRKSDEHLLAEHFRLTDLIHAFPDGHDAEQLVALCRAHIKIAPELISSDRRLAKMNHTEVFSVAHAGYNRLSAFQFCCQNWEEVIRLRDEALSGGWNVGEMKDRVAAAESKLAAIRKEQDWNNILYFDAANSSTS